MCVENCKELKMSIRTQDAEAYNSNDVSKPSKKNMYKP
jgi:hypothetical protein